MSNWPGFAQPPRPADAWPFAKRLVKPVEPSVQIQPAMAGEWPVTVTPRADSNDEPDSESRMNAGASIRRKIVGIAPFREFPMIRRSHIAALIVSAFANAPTRADDGSNEPFVLPATTLTVAAAPDFLARGQAPALTAPIGIDSIFQLGANSTQVLGGAYASGPPGPRSRAFDYAPFSIRQSVMMGAPEDHWWGRTNMECLLDLTGGSIFTSYGSYLVGATLFARKNWVDPGSPLVPYAQAGVGLVYSDASTDQSQHAIGLPLEFYLHLELGLKYFVAPNLSLDIEGGLQHISNGKLGERNYGVNCYGGVVGFTYYLPIGG